MLGRLHSVLKWYDSSSFSLRPVGSLYASEGTLVQVYGKGHASSSK